MQRGNVSDHRLGQGQVGIQQRNHLLAQFNRRQLHGHWLGQVDQQAELAFAVGGFQRQVFHRHLRLGGQDLVDVGFGQGLLGFGQLQLRCRLVGGSGGLHRLHLVLVKLGQHQHGRDVDILHAHSQRRRTHGFALVADLVDLVVDTAGQVVVLGFAGVFLLEAFDGQHGFLRTEGELAVGQLNGVLPGVETESGFFQVAGDGQPGQFSFEVLALAVLPGNLEAVHEAVSLDLLAFGGAVEVQVGAGEAHRSRLVLELQRQKFDVAVDRTGVTDIGHAFERRHVLGGGEPLLGSGVLFQLVVTGGHDRQPLERHQARERQRAVFDMVDEQQFRIRVVFAEDRTLAFQAVMGGAAEHPTIQGDQLQGHGAIDAGHGGLQFLVGVLDCGLQHRLQLFTGVPGAACTDDANGDNKTQKNDCWLIHEVT
ncbi:hypothetical protein ALP39_04881 [Pseudomonas marginalis pv. marginalis]|nr:hypothetical protein ALP39_04881 [Pseudomonas marginalis pv. marginalis]